MLMIIDVEAIRSAIVAGLPLRARWVLGEMPVEFDFTAARRELRPLSDDDLAGGEPETDWADLLIFGRYDCAEGGGASPWIAIRGSDGTVWGLDVEREDTVFRFSTSLERFIQTFVLLDRYLGHRRSLPSDIEVNVKTLDPDGYSDSEWGKMIEFARDVERGDAADPTAAGR